MTLLLAEYTSPGVIHCLVVILFTKIFQKINSSYFFLMGSKENIYSKIVLEKYNFEVILTLINVLQKVNRLPSKM